jgi:ubiquinone/menaquinone biosynthesis C-methylase UbiE
MNVSEPEESRIRSVYQKRTGDQAVYSFFNPGHLFSAHQLERKLVESFQQHEIGSLDNKKVLEVGCGTGSRLRELVRLGAKEENLYGIDLLQNAIDEAIELAPKADFRCGNAESLPFEDETFHIAMQFTMFTSILDDRMKHSSAKEMLRVLTGHGVIVWYDYFVSKPQNRDVKGIGRTEIIRLFPNCTFDFNRVTLAPPIARTLAPYSFLLCYLLEKIPLLRTHYLVIIRKRVGE